MLTKQEDSLIDLLRQVKEILDKHNIEFWLDSGTLLGAVRNEKFIPWDHDVDLAIWQEVMTASVKTSITRDLRSRGFKVYCFYNHMTTKKVESLVDITFYWQIGKNAIFPRLIETNLVSKFLSLFSMILQAPYEHEVNFQLSHFLYNFVKGILVVISRSLPYWFRKPLAKILEVLYKKIGIKDVSWEIPDDYFKDLSTIKFYGMDFKVPSNTQKYLAYRYGENWKIPKRNWETNINDGAVVSFQQR